MPGLWQTIGRKRLLGYLVAFSPSLAFTLAVVFLSVVMIGSRSKVSSSVVIPIITSVLEIYNVKLFKSPAQ